MRLALQLGLLLVAPAFAADFTATILHVNDTHDNIEPFLIQGKPYGGMARLATLVDQYRKSDPNPLFLLAGDAFQGTFYFNVYEGLENAVLFNTMHLDAMVVGNHELDKGPANLASFLEAARFPVITANLDVSAEPALKGKLQKSLILTRGGERIGIVGGTTEYLNQISNPGPNIHLLPLAQSLQEEVNALEQQGVNKIVLLTHDSYAVDLDLAKTLHGIDVIVGGDSHTLLGTTTAPGWPSSLGPYPTVVDNPDGGKTLVVQSWHGERVLGRLQVTFDEQGRVKKWGDSQPIAVDESVPEEPEVKAIVATLKKPVTQLGSHKVAVAAEEIAQGAPLGALITDAMLAATASANVSVALLNPGAIRAGIKTGDITFGMAITVQPFNNTLIVLELSGSELKQVLEDGAAFKDGQPLWVSHGTRYAVDLSKPLGSRISDLTIQGRPVDPSTTYRVSVLDFMAGGGDNQVTLKNFKGKGIYWSLRDIDVLIDYLAAHSPVHAPTEQRVIRLGD